ncbi:MAG: hypothetical protein NW214_15620 [Pseudanabaenaceae cyanobacterium bins.39]|nr:hypothetical protein [Pseudanabaenaceae cyanobacterium bins.39]
MSKINQIENALMSLGGAAFQKLADAYLHKKGYEQINSIGTVIGSDKDRTGNPDSLIALRNGKYVFVEYTTQEKGVYNKFNADLTKCFDETKTKISIKNIEEVVLCHTSILSSEEEESLREKCRNIGININIFGISTISYDLYQKYPNITRDFLGIEVDTRQIVTPDEFINLYNKNALATPLNTNFHFRESEIAEVLQKLEENNLIVISGKAGIGKSRFVLEICSRFAESNPEYKVKCIFLRGVNLFEDIRVYFSDAGKYLIFVDDANRVNRFEYFVQLLHDQREDQQIKVIATVRDYALDKILNIGSSYRHLVPIELKILEDKEIRQLVKDEYNINNPLYLDRITDISKGNPRLAIMISQVAKRENSLNSIFDISSLYDEYYRSIRQDLNDLNDENILKVAGIIAFFRVIDYANEEIMKKIESVFHISREIFWEAVKRLNDLEILDMYENEVVKTSDQILATYLFYLAYFTERVLNFADLLQNFFPSFQNRLVDVLNPILNAFNSEKIITIMRPDVDKAWEVYKSGKDEEILMSFMQVFWFLKETEILIYVSDYISKIQPEIIDLSTIDIKSNSNLSSPSLLTTLGLFIYSDEINFRIALELLFQYLEKSPSEVSKVLYLLTERFGFEYNSYAYGFFIQYAVIDELWKQTQSGMNELFSKLFIAVAKQYLKIHFNTSNMKDRRTVSTVSFDLQPTVELLQLRDKIWDCVFQFYHIQNFNNDVIDIIHKYSFFDCKVNALEIISHDASKLLPFIKSSLNPNKYIHCCLANNYLECLKSHLDSFIKTIKQVKYKLLLEILRYDTVKKNLGIYLIIIFYIQNLSEYFTNQAYTISRVLLSDRAERLECQLAYEDYEKFKREQITCHFQRYTFSDYTRFLDHSLEIQRELTRQGNIVSELPHRIVQVLTDLASRDERLYIQVIEHYLTFGNQLQLSDFNLVYQLIQICGVDKTYKLLSQNDYLSKQRWLFSFYYLLPQETITNQYLERLYKFYKESSLNEISNMDFLLRYKSIDENIITRVVEIILCRTTEDTNFSHCLSFIFNPYSEINRNLIELFKENLNLLKQAYFLALKLDSHIDHDMKNFANILNIDSEFIFEYIDWIYEQKDIASDFHDRGSYSFIWRRYDYEQLISRIIKYIHSLENKKNFPSHFIMARFFILKETDKDNVDLRKKQDDLLSSLVEIEHKDIEFMKLIFNITTQLSYESRRQLVAIFLKNNSRFEDFNKLPLEPSSWSYTNSAVPGTGQLNREGVKTS